MATNTAFPTRPYTSGLLRHNPTNPSQTASQQQQMPSFPASNIGASGAVPTQPQQPRDRSGHAQQQQQQQPNQLAELSEEQREEINEAFQLFDLDRDGHIDYHEFKVAMKALGFELPKQDIMELLKTHGVTATTDSGKGKAKGTAANTTGRRYLSLASFQTLMAGMIANRDPRTEILRAFELFDADGKGNITLADLRRVARELGEGLSDEELVAMIEEFDLDGDGAIGREEFVGICLG